VLPFYIYFGFVHTLVQKLFFPPNYLDKIGALFSETLRLKLSIKKRKVKERKSFENLQKSFLKGLQRKAAAWT
jgi:hypothetical protein